MNSIPRIPGMHIHILGICGTFMGGLAALAREAGHRVTGCDVNVYPPMSEQLRALGINLIEGFGADQLALQPDVFVVGNVVSRARLSDGQARYPLMGSILEAGSRYTSGPQWLAEHVLRDRHVLAVAGTHGKTTTTAMLAWILECAGRQPGFLVGGVPLNFPVSARLGSAQDRTHRAGPGKAGFFVIEADEYDTAFFDKRSKFVHYAPRTVILNNLEFDHADVFDDLAAIERQFHHLLRIVPCSGRVVVNGTQDSLQRVLRAGYWCEMKSFGAPGNDFTAEGPADDFAVLLQNQPVARVRWSLSGEHNQLNALAAVAAADHIGIPAAESAEALASFRNVRRRMELRGTANGVAVYDDFAHHPTAIRATLEGLRRQVGEAARILSVFEPRTNTMRLGAVKAQLAPSLAASDLAFCHAQDLGWDPREALAPLGSRLQVSHSIPELVEMVCREAVPGDHVVCMSNRGFGGVHEKLLEALARTAALAPGAADPPSTHLASSGHAV